MNYKLLMVLAVVFAMMAGGCKKEGDGILDGVITYDSGFMNQGPVLITGAWLYIFIDDDSDVTNGYVKLLQTDLLDIAEGTKALNYQMETSEIPEGDYYLVAAYDFETVDDNTDPENPLVWEAIGWYGSDNTNPPSSANVTDLSERYNITLHGLAK